MNVVLQQKWVVLKKLPVRDIKMIELRTKPVAAHHVLNVGGRHTTFSLNIFIINAEL